MNGPPNDLVILKATVTDERTLTCPLCTTDRWTVDVPPFERPPEALAGIFGMSGDTLTRVFVDQEVAKAASAMREHLRRHQPEEWLTWITRIKEER